MYYVSEMIRRACSLVFPMLPKVEGGEALVPSNTGYFDFHIVQLLATPSTMTTHLIVVSTLIAIATAVTTASFDCIATDVTTFPGCNAFFNSGEACAPKTDRAGKEACLCNQNYLDSLFE